MRPPIAPLCALLLAALGACAAPRREAARAPEPAPLAGPRSDYFPNYRLTTQDGRVVRFYDDLIHGRFVIVNFLYTRCTGI